MSDLKKRNKGFTLIELIIAIAMLAFLMTAVSMFMSSGIMNYKKTKADVRVHNSAQEVYDKISDTVMEAKQIYIFGYLEGDSKLYCFMQNDHTAANAAAQTTADTAKVTTLKSNMGTSFMNVTDIGIKYYEDYNTDTSSTVDIKIKAIVIDTAVSLSKEDFDDATSVKVGASTGKYRNQLTGKDVALSIATKKDADGNDVSVVDSDGNYIFNENDTVRHMYIFDEENMYYMTKYAFATAHDDNIVDNPTSKKSDFLYTSSLEKNADDTTAVTATVDVAKASVAINLNYDDKNMTYKTNGMIKIRNSFVLIAKK